MIDLSLKGSIGALIYGQAFLAGVFLHVTVFRVGEWDLYTPHILAGTAALNGLLTTALHLWIQKDAGDVCAAAWTASSLVMTAIAGIYTSMLIYRGAFHRLNRFPGPFAARLSNFYVTSLSVKKFHLYEEIEDLHKKYGDIVRVGPSELSVANPDAYQLIHSNQSPCVKGPWYNMMYPVLSLHMIRDRKEHARRRKTWDKGLNMKALRDYEPRVAEYTKQLLDQLEQNQGKEMDIATWFNFYSFDVMGDLAFGEGFDMLKEGIVHYYMKSVHANMLAVSTFTHLVWMFPLLTSIPILNNEHVSFQNWLKSRVERRRQRKSDKTDLLSWILGDFEALDKPAKQDFLNLVGDAHLIVVAGSDTTAASLTCLFYELALHPEVTQTLRSELDQYFELNQQPDHSSLAKLEYLQACIDESLRLHPPVPSGLQRMTPPEGLQLGDTFIPGNTIVQVPTHTLQRDERAFELPTEYIPERWTTRPELVRNASVFAPFSVGRYSCAGKQLGLMELRYVTSQVVHQYDFQLAPNQTAQGFTEGLKDSFTLVSPSLQLVFKRRPAHA